MAAECTLVAPGGVACIWCGTGVFQYVTCEASGLLGVFLSYCCGSMSSSAPVVAGMQTLYQCACSMSCVVVMCYQWLQGTGVSPVFMARRADVLSVCMSVGTSSDTVLITWRSTVPLVGVPCTSVLYDGTDVPMCFSMYSRGPRSA